VINWIFLTLLSAVLGSISSIFDRYILKNELRTSDTLVILWGFFATLMFCGPAILTGQISPNPLTIGLGAICALFYLGAMHYYYRCINSSELSRAVPIFSVNPVIILILASIFLNEVYQPRQYFGIVIIILGVFIDIIDQQKHRLINKKTILWACLAALAFAIKNILVKWQVIQGIEPYNILFWIGAFILIFNIPLAIKSHTAWNIKTKHHWPDLIIASTITAATTIIYTTAVTIGPATLIAFLDRIQILFVFILSTILDIFFPGFLKEKFIKAAFFQKLTGVLLILIGSYYLI